MSERDEIRRLQSIRDQMDQSCVINFADARGAIDDALNYMRERQARADLAAERERVLTDLARSLWAILGERGCLDPQDRHEIQQMVHLAKLEKEIAGEH